MRSRAIATTVATVCAAALGFASAAGAQATHQDSVTGSVFSTFTDWTIQADIHSGPAGQNPTGTFSESFHFGSGTNDFHIGDTTVTCLVVQGNQAVAVGTGTFGGGSTSRPANQIRMCRAGSVCTSRTTAPRVTCHPSSRPATW
jgi:hypothetical protein